jgi:hypothetical protein
MDPRTIFSSIEKTRDEIDAHVRRFAGARQHPIDMPTALAGMNDAVASILDATVVAQVATTIEHLQAINSPDQEVAGASAGSKAADPPIVDLDPRQYREIDP